MEGCGYKEKFVKMFLRELDVVSCSSNNGFYCLLLFVLRMYSDVLRSVGLHQVWMEGKAPQKLNSNSQFQMFSVFSEQSISIFFYEISSSNAKGHHLCKKQDLYKRVVEEETI